MNSVRQIAGANGHVRRDRKSDNPLVSVVVPAYNEAAIVNKNLSTLCSYMESLKDEYRWEMILVNDGSTDETGDLVEAFAKTRNDVHVLHHHVNFRLGQALRFAFNNCSGDYIVTMDLDLSYSPDHIGRMLAKIRESRARIVIASPYMKEGKISNVPWLRRTLSIWANRFLSIMAKGKLSTLTGMVRTYDRRFLSSLNLKATDVDINPEIIFKAAMLNARIVEIPAHLNWRFDKADGQKRKSSMRILSTIISCLMSGFFFRPVMFFIFPGLLLFLVSLYPLTWACIHIATNLQKLPSAANYFDAGISAAVRAAFYQSPHSFLVGGISLMVAIQLISLGILALQSKRYFEELFHLGSNIYKYNRNNGEESP
jgi:glycosyltransferase involved in cell wall biosynthesis